MSRGLQWFLVSALLIMTSPAAIAAPTDNNSDVLRVDQPSPPAPLPMGEGSRHCPAEKASKPQPNDYELYKALIDSIDQVERNYVTKVDRRKLVEAAIRGVLGSLDPYSTYISPEELKQFRKELASEFGGIGVQIDADSGEVKILSPIHDTPADRAGLLAGDRILEIDGRSTQGLDSDAAAELLKGKEGTEVSLLVAHTGDKAVRKVTLTREKIHLDTVLGDGRKPDGSWDYMLDPHEKIGYVRLTAFSRDTAGELRQVLTQLKKDGFRGLILDLRFNPGGLLASAIETSDLFISRGRIVSAAGRNAPERVWDARAEGTFQGFPLAVLVNRYSASSSEIVAACLQDHRRAVVIGERTWGKGSVQNLIELPDGQGAIKLTTAGYRRPDGKNIHRFPGAKASDEWGVMPDEGYRIELDARETLELLRDRRERDILRPGPKKAETPAFVDRQLQAAVKHIAAELDEKR